jgi:hypothetical protein
MVFAEVWVKRLFMAMDGFTVKMRFCKCDWVLPIYTCEYQYPYISERELVISVPDFIILRVNPLMSIVEMLFIRKYYQSSSNFQTTKCLVRSLILSPRFVLCVY